MKKRFFLALLCALLLSFSQLSEAASREELAAIRVASANDFQYWTDSSPAKAALIQYVKAVTDPDNPDFIPLCIQATMVAIENRTMKRAVCIMLGITCSLRPSEEYKDESTARPNKPSDKAITTTP